ncbi:MAG: class I SAM-dependent methyltransferase [Phenylobacterium sp.]|uniref:TylF/MycF/NovP-related O-methyltransferase n=1 Tax=Phenylobacterium sp. TaxID=1871053 RepID=UPI001A4A9E1E|nr:TylF/MycF/NovP-related O-methyltransferase [Phenylobacterium sp.]MBL8555370.1 class I SAM-dependent methyltransferase [Phenylobacterium sp.]
MASLTFNDVTTAQLLMMGDGLLEGGDLQLAKAVYQRALREAPPAERQRIHTRIGLASVRTRRTPLLVNILKAIESSGFSNADPFVADGMATWLKTLPFQDDHRFLELAEKHSALLPIANWHWNLFVALWAVRECRNVPGDFVELGVFKGHTTLFCSEYVGFSDWPKTWWLYDTFDGIPDDQQAKGWENANKSLYQGTFSYEEVRDRFAHAPNIKVIKGRVPEILEEGAPGQIAFMHVDMNNAPAEIAALEKLFDRVSPGGIILFDDFCWSTARAQYDAETAWFAARGLQILGLPTGQGLFLKR